MSMSQHSPPPNTASAVTPAIALDELAALLAPLTSEPDATATCTAWLERLAAGCGARRGSLLMLHPDLSELRLLAATGFEPGSLDATRPPQPRSISSWVLQHGRGILIDGEVRDRRFQGSAPGAGIQSALSMPLCGPDGVIGVINLARLAPAPPFSAADMAPLEPALASFAVAIETHRHRERAQRHYRRVRSAPDLLATRVPAGESEARSYTFARAHRGGRRTAADLCERASDPTGAQTLLVADVSGDGPEALATAGLVQGLFLGLATNDRTPLEIVVRIGAELHARFEGRRHAALWVVELATNGQMASCNAGLPPPFWLPEDGGPALRLTTGGPVAGALARGGYEQETLRLLPGDTVIATSDAVIAAYGSDPSHDGAARLEEVAGEQRRLPLARLVDLVVQGDVEAGVTSLPADDLTVFALRFTPGH